MIHGHQTAIDRYSLYQTLHTILDLAVYSYYINYTKLQIYIATL